MATVNDYRRYVQGDNSRAEEADKYIGRMPSSYYAQRCYKITTGASGATGLTVVLHNVSQYNHSQIPMQAVVDETQGAYTNTYSTDGTAGVMSGTYQNGEYTWTITGLQLLPNHVYYLHIFGGSSSARYYIYADYAVTNITVTESGSYGGIVYIDEGGTFAPYQCYICDGDSWELYQAKIDSGGTWEDY